MERCGYGYAESLPDRAVQGGQPPPGDQSDRDGAGPGRGHRDGWLRPEPQWPRVVRSHPSRQAIAPVYVLVHRCWQWYPRLTGHGAGQQGLACPWWADQQHALGNMRSDLEETLGIAQEVDNFTQFHF